MTMRSGHVKESRLFESYVDERAGEPMDPRIADHLATCAECASRFHEYAAMLNELRAAADAETEAVFSPARLDEQRQAIMGRLAHVHRPARVISFPSRDLAADSRPSSRMTLRWVAGAAAAGLFIGFAAGGYLGPERLHRSTARLAQSAPTAMAVQRATTAKPVVRVGIAQPDPADDDAFLMELEVALARPHARELQPFDAMTPRVSDIENRGR
jgi:anti-sigma factor RsiW